MDAYSLFGGRRMRSLVCLTFLVGLSFQSHADIYGVSNRQQLIHGLQLTFGIKLKQLKIDLQLQKVLPSSSDAGEVNSSFMRTWQQVAYIACAQALKEKNAKDAIAMATIEAEAEPVNRTKLFNGWVDDLARRSWGQLGEDSASEVRQIIDVSGSLSDSESIAKTMSASCALVVGSARTYLKTN